MFDQYLFNLFCKVPDYRLETAVRFLAEVRVFFSSTYPDHQCGPPTYEMNTDGSFSRVKARV
jgi:hypothetical protein